MTKLIYHFVRLPIQPGLKRRLWRRVHAELIMIPWSYGSFTALHLRRFPYDTRVPSESHANMMQLHRLRRAMAVARAVAEFT